MRVQKYFSLKETSTRYITQNQIKIRIIERLKKYQYQNVTKMYMTFYVMIAYAELYV